MTVGTILAHLSHKATAARLADAGLALAERLDAHLVAQHTLEGIMVYPGVEAYFSPSMSDAVDAAQTARADAIEAIFRERAGNASARCEWRTVRGAPLAAADRMAVACRNADLVLLALPGSADAPSEHRHVAERVVRGGGRPVLLVPEAGIGGGVGRRVVMAHADAREAARAAFDALPLLAQGAAIHLVHVGGDLDAMRHHSMIEMSAVLARHGHDVVMTQREPHHDTVAEVLVREAREVGADMLVAGAFGHSRAYEFLFGATTSALLRDAPVPLLLSC
ncbi:universal stress protein [Jannaschia sp. W003]|uniref:universal stress protein n=1 Tax=Jannaschia sp. W003 TaxID=2867012 RepID=UPI0021A91AB9|nr:universal stress protein [Jannaschia sp. W003]UWQ22429.1 universal stress protein [Jannaschia sp. W003]